VPTYNEGLEVLTPTVAAAVAMRVAHETWVLDDGDRPEVARLAADLGAHYLTRPTHEHAKAGNLNHALGKIEADFIGVLDADHVASPDFLVHTLGYFDDPGIALVQTPQDFYNLESFEHERGGATRALTDPDLAGTERFHEQALFYRVLQPGKNRWGGAFWCGTGAVPIRADALTFTLFFGLTLFLQQLAMRVLSRGCHRPFLSILFEFVRMTPNLLATLSLVTRRKVAFRVTPKGRTGNARHAATEPRLLRFLAIFSIFAAAWFGLTVMGVTFTRYAVPWAAYGAFGWLVLNVVLLVSAIGRVRDLRYAGERRASVRFETTFAGSFDGGPSQILDLSLTGARVAVDALSEMDEHHLVVELDGREVAVEAAVRSQRPDGAGRTILGLEFLPDQNLARADLALALFQTTVVDARSGGAVGTRAISVPADGAKATEESAAA
jgi:hypothetical protein